MQNCLKYLKVFLEKTTKQSSLTFFEINFIPPNNLFNKKDVCFAKKENMSIKVLRTYTLHKVCLIFKNMRKIYKFQKYVKNLPFAAWKKYSKYAQK